MPPLGRPVSHAMQIPDGLRAPELRDVLRAIDSVHGDGDLSVIPLTWAPLADREGSFRTDPTTGAPLRIVIRNTGKLRRLTVLHEIGDFIDYQGIGVSGRFASASSRLLQPWRAAVRRSRSVAELMAVRERDARLSTQATPTEPLLAFRRQFVRYLLTSHETWARCYTQFVATSSRVPMLLDELAIQQNVSPGIPQYWDEDDFAPIAGEIERLFRRLRWLE